MLHQATRDIIREEGRLSLPRASILVFSILLLLVAILHFHHDDESASPVNKRRPNQHLNFDLLVAIACHVDESPA